MARSVLGLALLSFGFSLIAGISRAKLWFGPETVVLGVTGAIMSLLVLVAGIRMIGNEDARWLDRVAIPPWLLFAAGFAVSVLILRVAFAGFANSADEWGFLFEARTFLHGRLWNPQPPDPGLFQEAYLITRDGKWVSQYLPGWPAILAAVQWIGLPPWLAAPGCGVMLLAILWAGLRLECRYRPLALAMLASYAASGFFLLNASTYFSHCASAAMVAGSVVCMLMAERHSGSFWPVAAGGCVGMALLCRLDSGLLAGLGAMLGWMQQGGKPRTAVLGLAGGVPFLAALALYDWQITGHPFVLPTEWAGTLTIGAGGLGGVEAGAGRLRPVIQTLWRGGQLADTASLLLPAFYAAALFQRLRNRRTRFYDALPLANIGMFLVFPDLGGWQMGPRYWFDGVAIMPLTVASVFAERELGRFCAVCFLLMAPISLARLPAQTAFFARVIRQNATVFQLATGLPRDRKAVVLVPNFYSQWDERADRTSPNLASAYVRNDPDLTQGILFARADVPDARARACAAEPGAAVYGFTLDASHQAGQLTPLPCSSG